MKQNNMSQGVSSSFEKFINNLITVKNAYNTKYKYNISTAILKNFSLIIGVILMCSWIEKHIHIYKISQSLANAANQFVQIYAITGLIGTFLSVFINMFAAIKNYGFIERSNLKKRFTIYNWINRIGIFFLLAYIFWLMSNAYYKSIAVVAIVFIGRCFTGKHEESYRKNKKMYSFYEHKYRKKLKKYSTYQNFIKYQEPIEVLTGKLRDQYEEIECYSGFLYIYLKRILELVSNDDIRYQTYYSFFRDDLFMKIMKCDIDESERGKRFGQVCKHLLEYIGQESKEKEFPFFYLVFAAIFEVSIETVDTNEFFSQIIKGNDQNIAKDVFVIFNDYICLYNRLHKRDQKLIEVDNKYKFLKNYYIRFNKCNNQGDRIVCMLWLVWCKNNEILLSNVIKYIGEVRYYYNHHVGRDKKYTLEYEFIREIYWNGG